MLLFKLVHEKLSKLRLNLLLFWHFLKHDREIRQADIPLVVVCIQFADMVLHVDEEQHLNDEGSHPQYILLRSNFRLNSRHLYHETKAASFRAKHSSVASGVRVCRVTKILIIGESLFEG